MTVTSRDERFFASTRGQVVQLLRRGSRTVEDLATALALTDNAVRAHLAALERDGLVAQSGVRRATGKPAFLYELTPEAERLYPRAYGTLLHEVLDVLVDRVAPDTLDGVLRETGRRLARGHAATGDLQQRVEQATTLLGELGGLADIEERENGFVIRGCSCPIAAAVQGHPEACQLAESLLAEVIGVPVRQVCDQGPPPRCAFEVPARSA